MSTHQPQPQPRQQPHEATLIVSESKADIPDALHNVIVDIATDAIAARGVFSIALSGGSLPKFLSGLADTYQHRSVEPNFDSWHVILADERCVVSTDIDSNLGALRSSFFDHVSIPTEQIYGIHDDDINRHNMTADEIASKYETVVRDVLNQTHHSLDLALLGFGPDGHTASLFPSSPLLKEQERWVSFVEDSPKPPPRRITLTYPVLNSHTRHVIFCGAGESKSAILKDIFATVDVMSSSSEAEEKGGGRRGKQLGTRYSVTMKDPPPYPCAGVLPNSTSRSDTTTTTTTPLTWIVDKDAASDIFPDDESTQKASKI